MELGPQAGTVCTLPSAEGAMSVQGTTMDTAAQRVCAGPQAWGGGLTASIPRLSFSLVKLHHMDTESALFHTQSGFFLKIIILCQ